MLCRVPPRPEPGPSTGRMGIIPRTLSLVYERARSWGVWPRTSPGPWRSTRPVSTAGAITNLW